MNHHGPTSRWEASTRPPGGRCVVGRGFTLIEMLVVAALMILMMGLGVPTIVGMVRSGRVEAGINAISAAVTLSQARLQSPTPARIDLAAAEAGDVSLLPMRSVVRSADTAILFTPSGEIRFLEVDETAVDGSGNPNPLSRNPVNVTGGNPPTIRYRVAFKDRTDVESIRIPSGIGIVGITRGGSGAGSVQLLPPPFAIRFDGQGRLIQGHKDSAPDWMVFYDGDYNGTIPVTTTTNTVMYRSGSSKRPDAFDRNGPLYDPEEAWKKEAKAANKAVVPLEAIDTVVGVILYDKNKFYGNFTDGWPAYRDQDASGAEYDDCCKWVIANGKPVFFSRYSGSLLME